MPYAMPTPGQNEWLHLGPAGVCRRARCRSHLKSRAAIHQVQVCVFVGPSMSRWRCLCTWPRPPASSRAVAHTPVQLVHVCMCFCVCAIVTSVRVWTRRRGPGLFDRFKFGASTAASPREQDSTAPAHAIVEPTTGGGGGVHSIAATFQRAVRSIHSSSTSGSGKELGGLSVVSEGPPGFVPGTPPPATDVTVKSGTTVDPLRRRSQGDTGVVGGSKARLAITVADTPPRATQAPNLLARVSSRLLGGTQPGPVRAMGTVGTSLGSSSTDLVPPRAGMWRGPSGKLQGALAKAGPNPLFAREGSSQSLPSQGSLASLHRQNSREERKLLLATLKSSVKRSKMELLVDDEDAGKGTRSVGNALSAKSIQAFHKVGILASG